MFKRGRWLENPPYGQRPQRRYRRTGTRQPTSAREDFGGLRVETALVRGPGYRIGPPVTCAADAVYLIQSALADDPDERFLVLMLDGKNHSTGIYEAAHGSTTQVEVHPKNVFRAAILANAAAIIVVHNHPSTDPEPSVEDKELADRIVRAGILIGIPVLDFLVIGGGSYVSFGERGLI